MWSPGSPGQGSWLVDAWRRSVHGADRRVNRVRVTVDDLRRAVDAEVERSWSDGQWLRWLDAAADLREQTFRNVVLIKLQMPRAIWVDGREAWQLRGRRIVRGASGIRIVAPAVDRTRSAGPVQGHGVATMWDVSQTTGRPVGLSALQTAADTSPQDLFAALVQVAGAAGYRVDRGRAVAANRHSETDHRQRRIVVTGDLGVAAAVLSLAHELAHVRMHKLSRDSTCHGITRLEADSAAYVLAARFGCLPDGPSASLVGRAAGVIGRRPSARLVETLGGRAVAAARRLIDATEQHLPQEPVRRATFRETPSFGNGLDRRSDGPELT